MFPGIVILEYAGSIMEEKNPLMGEPGHPGLGLISFLGT